MVVCFAAIEERVMLTSDLEFFFLFPLEKKKGEKLGQLSLYHSINSQQ